MESALNGFFVGCNDEIWTEVVNTLVRDGICFDYVGGMAVDLARLKCVENSILHDTHSAYRGRLPIDIGDELRPVDGVTLDAYQDAESICMELGDRDDIVYSYSYQERQRLYVSMLSFWLTMVDKHQPQFIIFPTTPHTIYDHVLYHVAKKEDIPVLMFLSISTLKRILPFNDYTKSNADVLVTYRKYLDQSSGKDTGWTLAPDLQEYIDNHQKTYSQVMPDYLQQRLQTANQGASGFARLFGVLKKLVKISRYKQYLTSMLSLIELQKNKLLDVVNPVAPINYLKQPFQSLESTDGLNGVEWRRYKRWAAKYKKELRAQHDSYTVPLDTSAKYIYVPLQFQPERTSCPEGGRYSNQLLMLRLLAYCLPNGWKIIVKENPSQLLPHTMHGERGRYAYYYHDLVGIDGVSIVPLDTNQFDLIDNAQAIATLTGTTGWEALMRAKPVLTFGYAWYNGCEGVFHAPDIESCHQAIAQIEKGVEVDKNKVHCYMAALDAHSFKGLMKIKRYKNKEQGIKNNVEQLLPMIESFLNKQVANKK